MITVWSGLAVCLVEGDGSTLTNRQSCVCMSLIKATEKKKKHTTRNTLQKSQNGPTCQTFFFVVVVLPHDKVLFVALSTVGVGGEVGGQIHSWARKKPKMKQTQLIAIDCFSC